MLLEKGYAGDVCVDPNDIENLLFHGTGGWDDDYEETKGRIVTLEEGVNEIKVKVPYGADNSPMFDYLKIEGLPSPTIQSKFRNPPHFLCKKPNTLLFVCSFCPCLTNHSTKLLLCAHSFDC